MEFNTFVTTTVSLLILIFTRILYLIFIKSRKIPSKRLRNFPARTVIVLGSGGHTTEMLRVVSHMSLEKYTPRIYVRAHNDDISLQKVKEIENGNEDYNVISIPRSREIMATSSSLIMELVSWQLLIDDLIENTMDEIKVHILPICKALRINDKEKYTPLWIENALLRMEACLDRIWETLNSGYWKDVPFQYRYAYSHCSVIKVVLLELQYRILNNDTPNEKCLRNIILQIDNGILLGMPIVKAPTLLTAMASKVNEHLSKILSIKSESNIETVNIHDIDTNIFPEFSPVVQYWEPSMETFYRDIFVPKVPAILQGCMTHWKALKLWQDTAYLERLIGMRTVPIEIGSRYTEEDWTQTLITFSEFIRKHINNKNDKIGYLAQHQLFDQVPELKDDFTIPEYCSFSNIEDEGSLPDINAWFGPSGTVSPLHFDPKNNLLCQVFGCKRIILYDPKDSPYLYPYESRLLSNTAQVDPYQSDDEKWPNFRKAKGFMCYLKPGEMLFIPPKWWHHVVSLSSSFSISFWWN